MNTGLTVAVWGLCPALSFTVAGLELDFEAKVYPKSFCALPSRKCLCAAMLGVGGEMT